MQRDTTVLTSEASTQLESPVNGRSQASSTQDTPTSSAVMAAPSTSNSPAKAKKKPRTPKAAKAGTSSSIPALNPTNSLNSVVNETLGQSAGTRKKQKKKAQQKGGLGALDQHADQASPQTPINRFKAQHPTYSASPYSFAAPSEFASPAWQGSPSLVYFSGPSSSQFERVLNASFPTTINGLQTMIRSKLRVELTAPLQMSFVNTDANVCPLDDEDDLEALVANAAQSKRIKVQVNTASSKASSVVSNSLHPQTTGTQNNGSARPAGTSTDHAPTATPSTNKSKAVRAPRQSKAAVVTDTASSDSAATPQTAPAKTSGLRWEDRPTAASLLAAIFPTSAEPTPPLKQIGTQDAAPEPASTTIGSASKNGDAPQQAKKTPAKRKRQSAAHQSSSPPTSGPEKSAASQVSATEPLSSQPGAGKRPRVEAQVDQAAPTETKDPATANQEAETIAPTPAKKPRAKASKSTSTTKAVASTPNDAIFAEPVIESGSAAAATKDPVLTSSVPEAATVSTTVVPDVPTAIDPTSAATDTNAPIKRKPGRPRKTAPLDKAATFPLSQETSVSNAAPDSSPASLPPKTNTPANKAKAIEAVAPASARAENATATEPSSPPKKKAPAKNAKTKDAHEGATQEVQEPVSQTKPIATDTPAAAENTNPAASPSNSTTQVEPLPSPTAKPKAKTTRSKAVPDRCVVCKQSPNHAKEECQIFKAGPQGVHDLLQEYQQMKSRKKEDRETVETLREWSSHLNRGESNDDDMPLTQTSAVIDASTAPIPSQAESTASANEFNGIGAAAEPAKKARAPTKKAAAAAGKAPEPTADLLELPPPSGVEAVNSLNTKKATTPAKKKKQKDNAQEPNIAVIPSSPLGPDSSQPVAQNDPLVRGNGLRAPSESSEAELATSPLLSAVPRADEDMDIDPLNATPVASTANSQLEERRSKLKEADSKNAETEAAPSEAAQAGVGSGSRSASVTSSDTSENSDNSDSETQTEDESESEKTLNMRETGSAANRKDESKSPTNGADRASSSSSSSSSQSSSASSSSSDSDASSSDSDSEKEETASKTPVAKKNDDGKSNGTPTTAISNPFLRGLTPQGNAKNSAAFSPKSTPFTRLSELKPSMLRQNMSQPSSPMSGGGSNGLGAQSQNSFFASKPSAVQNATESSGSDSESDSDSSSSSSSSGGEGSTTSKGKKTTKGEHKEKGSSKRVIPASKRAGASTSPKKRKGPFSVFF